MIREIVFLFYFVFCKTIFDTHKLFRFNGWLIMDKRLNELKEMSFNGWNWFTWNKYPRLTRARATSFVYENLKNTKKLEKKKCPFFNNWKNFILFILKNKTNLCKYIIFLKQQKQINFISTIKELFNIILSVTVV